MSKTTRSNWERLEKAGERTLKNGDAKVSPEIRRVIDRLRKQYGLNQRQSSQSREPL